MKKSSSFAVAGDMTLSACLPAAELSVDDIDLARYASAMAQAGGGIRSTVGARA